jgi:hypothetical protein
MLVLFCGNGGSSMLELADGMESVEVVVVPGETSVVVEDPAGTVTGMLKVSVEDGIGVVTGISTVLEVDGDGVGVVTTTGGLTGGLTGGFGGGVTGGLTGGFGGLQSNLIS